MPNTFYAINAKIGFMKKGLLQKEDYEKLLSFARREEIIAFLKENPLYKEQIANYMELSLEHRYMTEFMLKKAEVELFLKLKHFLLGEDKILIDSILKSYEFEDIKIILRSILEPEPIDLKNETLLYNLNKHVDYDKLARSETMNQALDILMDTPYKRAFVSLTDKDVFRLHFHIEMNLDSMYFLGLRKASKKFSHKNSTIINSYFRELTDTLNIQWILRAKKYYNLSNSEIYNYSLRFGKYIHGAFLKDLVYSETPEDVIEKLSHSKLKNVFYKKEEDVSLSYRHMQAYVYKKELSKLSNYENSISTLLKFIIQVLVQNENITRIVEAQKYALNKEDTRKYLITTR